MNIHVYLIIFSENTMFLFISPYYVIKVFLIFISELKIENKIKDNKIVINA